MEITIKTKNDHHPESNKTLTIISALIVGIMLAGAIFYTIYVYKNKPTTVFCPVQNTQIKTLLKDSEGIKKDNIKDKGKLAEAKRVFKRLEKECKAKNLLDTEQNVMSKDTLLKDIKTALKKGEEAEDAIKDFMEQKRAGNSGGVKKETFHKLVHGIIKTSSEEQKTPPTDEQIKAASDQLIENLKKAQTEWDNGKEDGKSYENIYTLYKLGEEYTRINALIKENEVQASKPAS